MRVYHRISVAVAMTVVALIATAFAMVWMQSEDMAGWTRFNHTCLFVLMMAGACSAWMVLKSGEKPSLLAPCAASYIVFLVGVGVILVTCGVTLTSKSTSVKFPEPAGTILMWIEIICAVYVTGMGFWLRKAEGE